MLQTNVRFNPCIKFIIAIVISLEVSIKLSLIANCTVLVICLLLLLLARIKFKHLLELIFIPFIAAISTFCSVYFYASHDLYYALNLFTRIYVYVWTIACVGLNTTASDFARSLEQNFHLPSKFAYGCLAAIGIVPQIRANIKQIRTAGMMRGVKLSFWSPALYFKAIIQAIYSAEKLAEGMDSHGFREEQPRSVIAAIPILKRDYALLFIILGIFNILLLLFK